jgi:DNA polymerase-3 subunit epsilon
MTDPTTLTPQEELSAFLLLSQSRHGWDPETWQTTDWGTSPQPPLLALDTETTGGDTAHDRIVTVALVAVEGPGPNQGGWVCQWLVDPGVPIPAAAQTIHGITDTMAAKHGHPPVDVLGEIIDLLLSPATAELPLVIFNAPFDLGILQAEESRHLGSTHLRTMSRPVIDPMVLDRHLDRYRRGKRTLSAVADVHQIDRQAEDHNACADALTAAKIAWSQLQRNELQQSAAQLHEKQTGWARQQRESFADYLDSQGRHDEARDVLARSWPV